MHPIVTCIVWCVLCYDIGLCVLCYMYCILSIILYCILPLSWGVVTRTHVKITRPFRTAKKATKKDNTLKTRHRWKEHNKKTRIPIVDHRNRHHDYTRIHNKNVNIIIFLCIRRKWRYCMSITSLFCMYCWMFVLLLWLLLILPVLYRIMLYSYCIVIL